MTRVVGVDTAYPVTRELLRSASAVLGQVPAFWGRYFTSPTAGGGVEYRHRIEDQILAEAAVRVLPIARQTNHVGGTIAEGARDAELNARDLVATFGETLLSTIAEVALFLDVEGSGRSKLSVEYYVGWANGLSVVGPEVRILPCVYGLPSDSETWDALGAAVAEGCQCGGIWSSRPHAGESVVEPHPWDPEVVRPRSSFALPPVVLWQYSFAKKHAQFDRNLAAPGYDLLSKLVLPPLS